MARKSAESDIFQRAMEAAYKVLDGYLEDAGSHVDPAIERAEAIDLAGQIARASIELEEYLAQIQQFTKSAHASAHAVYR